MIDPRLDGHLTFRLNEDRPSYARAFFFSKLLMSKSKAKTASRETPASAIPSRAFSIPRLLAVILTGLFLAGIFLLPYHVPLHNPSDSQSWEFGFNNTVAQGLIALLLFSLFAWHLLFGCLRLDRDPVARVLLAEHAADAPGSLRPLLYTMGILQLTTCLILLLWYAVLPMTHYGEFTYFIQRVEAVVLGRVPYVDFAFDYGPALLALPVGIYRLFDGAVSVDAAYIASLIIHFTIGYALLAYVVSQVHARGRVFIFAMIGFQWINLTMGLQYTPLRFTIGLASLFALRHLHRVTRDSPFRRILLLALAGFLFPLLNFSISPEMGLALTISLFVYFLWFLFGPERRLALLALSVLASISATALIFPRPYFNSILSFGKGGANFPIFPTIHILSFLAVAIWVLPRLGIIAIRDKSAAAPFCAGLAFLCGLFILPATGRCDPGHIWINSVSLLLIALAAASWLPPKSWYITWALYLLVFPVTQQFSNWDNYKDPIQSALAIRRQLAGTLYDSDNYAHLAPGDPRPPIHYGKLLPMAGLDTLPNAKIGLPLGDNEVMERFFKLTGRYVPEYHIPPYGDVFDASDLARKYQDMRAMEYVFIPSYYLNYLKPMNSAFPALQAQADNKFLSGLLLFPVDLPLVHPIFQPERDIMHQIASEYTLVQQYQSGVLLKRKE
jgi:hypothetical protein